MTTPSVDASALAPVKSTPGSVSNAGPYRPPAVPIGRFDGLLKSASFIGELTKLMLHRRTTRRRSST